MLELFRRIPLAARLLLGMVAAIVILGFASELLWLAQHNAYQRYPLSGACYSVIGKSGAEYKSWYAPVPADTGVYVFNNDHTWGYVFGPEAMVADRDCLRERYPDEPGAVPPLQGED